jgi:hypothetical protein
MILVEVCELVVEEHPRLQVGRQGELDDAAFPLRTILILWIVNVGITRCCWTRKLLVLRAQTVLEAVARHCRELRGSVGWACGQLLAVGVIKGHFVDFGRCPDEQSANWSEDETNEKQGGQNCLGGKDWLPCLQALLLEGGIWVSARVRLLLAARKLRTCRAPPASLILL